VGVASKNDPELVAQIYRQRKDLLLEADSLFPIEVNWGAKSQSVGKILEAWNIGAEAVIFIDDSPMEVAEVMAAHPHIQGIVFPKDDPAAVINLLTRLRQAFGKRTITAEDKLRARSLRGTAGGSEQDSTQPGTTSEDFLQSANAVLRIDCTNPPRDGRALELVNKTNQFNLNGLRYTEAEWQAQLRRQNALVCVVSYEDRFGPLGRISVLAGAVEEDVLKVSTWVMSCRAFSRRIEHGCLRYLFDQLGVRAIEFKFSATSRNGPLQQFLHSILGSPPAPDCILDRDSFNLRCPALYHELVVEMAVNSLALS
jgi:FkbH-like protein